MMRGVLLHAGRSIKWLHLKVLAVPWWWIALGLTETAPKKERTSWSPRVPEIDIAYPFLAESDK